MTPFERFSVAQAVVTAVGVFVAWGLRRGFMAGKWTQSHDYDGAIAGITKRLDSASALTSKLASEVQGLPERMRQEREPLLEDLREQVSLNRHDVQDIRNALGAFRAVADERHVQALRDHARYEQQIDALFRRMNQHRSADDT